MIAILLHDGFYGCGTGAGRANHTALRIIARAAHPDHHIHVLPIALEPASLEHTPAWHAHTATILTERRSTTTPLDNATRAQRRFGGLDNFRAACTDAAHHLNRTATETALIVAFDAPFHGLAPLLRPDLRPRTLVVPRSTAALHAPEDHRRRAWEQDGLTTLVADGGHVAAISTHMRHHLATDYQIPHHALIDLPDGLARHEHPSTAPVARLLPEPAREGFLLAMGRATPSKGFDDLLDALVLLRTVGKPPHLVLAAVTETRDPTPYQRHLAQRIENESIDATLTTRFDPALPSLMAHPALRAIVVPSRTEPFGRIPLEAFTAGAGPVVATRAGGLVELVYEGVTGYTAAPNNPSDLATALHRALSATPAQRACLRAAGVSAAKSRDYDHTIITALDRLAPAWRSAPVQSV